MAGQARKKRVAVPPARGRRRVWLAAAVLVLLLAGGGSLWLLAGGPRERSIPWRIVARYPHDSQAFTQGLLHHGGYLYESTGRYGASSLRRVEIETGRVLARRDLEADLFGEGLALRGGRLYQLTWRAGRGFVYDIEDLSRVGEFTYRGEGWGLTQEGGRFILSDGTPFLRFLDGETLEETGTVEVRGAQGHAVPRLNELEMAGGLVLANQWHADRVAAIDLSSGRVLGWLELGPLREEAQGAGGAPEALNGLAWDAGAGLLYVTGKNWPLLFVLELHEGLPRP